MKRLKKCSKVKFGNKVLWTHDGAQNPYPETVLKLKNKEIRIIFKGGATKTYKLDGEKWKGET